VLGATPGGGPDRKQYKITVAGVGKVEAWLSEPERPEPMLQATLFVDMTTARLGYPVRPGAHPTAPERLRVRVPVRPARTRTDGALDSLTGEKVMDLMVETARAEGTAVILVTHDARVAPHADRQITVRDGQIIQRE
jgi:putative ABC transport system ATP-binding protein